MWRDTAGNGWWDEVKLDDTARLVASLEDELRGIAIATQDRSSLWIVIWFW